MAKRGPKKGYKQTPEHIANMLKAINTPEVKKRQCERTQTPESNESRSRKLKGRPKPPGTGEKISEALTGRSCTPKAIANMVAAQNRPDVKAKKSKAATARVKSSEEIEKMRKANIGKPCRQETKDKLRKKLAGIKQSPEVVKRKSGPLSSAWKGGISFIEYPPTFNKTLREKIRARDGNRCTLHENQLECKGRLIVHHIDYDKRNCNSWNLITVCNRGNSEINFNREHWTKFFQTKYANLLQQKLQD